MTAETADHRAMRSAPTGERLSALETWVEGHEKLCSDRYEGLRGDLKWIKGGVGAVLIAVVGWALVQVWSTRNYVPPTPATAVSVIQSNSHAGGKNP